MQVKTMPLAVLCAGCAMMLVWAIYRLVRHYETQKWDWKCNITITKKMELSISATITRVTMKHRSMCHSVFNWQKLALCSASMVAKKEQKRKRRWEDDRTLIKSDHTSLNLIFCGPEQTDKNDTHREVMAACNHPCSCRLCCTYGPTPKGSGSLWEWPNTQ